MTRVTLVVALARNGVIGKNGALPWQLPDDLKRFKALTLGKPVIMGRKTYESIGKPLPGRQNIVVSRRPQFAVRGCQVARSLAHALELAGPVAEVCVIGGGALYEAALPLADRLELTRVDADVAGDVSFPRFDERAFNETARTHHDADARHAHAFDFVTLERTGT